MNNLDSIKKILDKADTSRSTGDSAFKVKLRTLLIDRKLPLIYNDEGIETIDVLGTGSYAKVDLVKFLGKLYAHKKPISNTENQKNSIADEALKLTEFNDKHPNIQQINFVTFTEKGRFGILIDYCSNGSLDSIVKDKSNHYTFTDVINWSYQLADALNFLHQKRISHRDVKIQNILLKDDKKTLVLTDYGTAVSVERCLMTCGVGTPITMAPEVLTSNQYTEKCDVFSWSIVFWQLMTHEMNPYDAQNRSFIFEVANQKLRPDKLRGLPQLLTVLLYRSWHSNPNSRPSFSFIKIVLKLILDKLPKTPIIFNQQLLQAVSDQWTGQYNLPIDYLPSEPRSNSEKSMNLYQEHLGIVERIMKIHHRIEKLETYRQLLEENETLKQQLERARSVSQTHALTTNLHDSMNSV